jgi:protein TonB
MPRAPFPAIRRSSTSLALSLLLSSVPVSAGFPGLHTVGLAVHQDTGRDIYLAVLRSSDASSAGQFLLGQGTRLMEQRVVARRTSARSLLGNLLLQAELATGAPPSAGTTRFVSDLMDAVRGSLYRGDSLEIARRASGEVVAYLNQVELARTDDADAFAYLLAGWTGDSGASAAFRQALTSPVLDPDLAARYQRQTTDPERVAAVMAWTDRSDAAEPTAAERAVADADPVADATAAAVPLDVAAAAGAGAGVALASMDATSLRASSRPARQDRPVVATPPVPPATVLQPQPAAAAEAGIAPDPATGAGAVAALDPGQTAIGPGPVAETAILEASEYSRRLGEFNDLVVRRVYAEIEYPRAAVRRSLEGALDLDVTIGSDGALTEVVVARSSGYRMLDGSAVRAAMKGLKRIDRDYIDPVAVAEYGSESGELVIPVPVTFRLQ